MRNFVSYSSFSVTFTFIVFDVFEVAQKWHKEAEERAREEMERQLREQERTRRPSRFEVIPAPDILKMQRQSVNDLTMSSNNNGGPDHVSHTFVQLTLTSIDKRSGPRIIVLKRSFAVVPLCYSAGCLHSPRKINIFSYFYLFFSAYVPFTGIRLATKEVNPEEDEFFHSKRVQPVGQPGCDTLYNRYRRGKQASYSLLLYHYILYLH